MVKCNVTFETPITNKHNLPCNKPSECGPDKPLLVREGYPILISISNIFNLYFGKELNKTLFFILFGPT